MIKDINNIILIITILFASFFDIKFKRIPNVLTFPVILWGLIFATIMEGFKGFQFSICGFLFGMGVFFIPFALNLMGGGDVKLMGAIGALMGWKFTVSVILYSGFVGGVIAIVISIFNKRLINIMKVILGMILIPLSNFLYNKTQNGMFLKVCNYFNMIKLNKKKESIPYGVAITIGALLVLSGIVPRLI